MRTASLPMYNFAGLQGAHSALWNAIAQLLRDDGIDDVPAMLDFDARPVPEVILADVLFTQTCGYPLLKSFAGQFRMLATPSYDLPGCSPGTHCAFIILRDDDPRSSAAELAGGRFAVNSLRSNSGMNLPRRLFAPLAADGRFFSEVVPTGGHPASLDAVRMARVDAASVDCLTWAYACDHHRELVAGLRILCETPASPAIPLITSIATPRDHVAALQKALLEIGHSPAFASIRAALSLSSIDAADEAAYAILLDYEREAAEAGYPQLA